MKLSEWVDQERGRQSALARAVGVDSQLVWQWARGMRQVPADRCPAIERATEGAVRCEDLRPDVEWGVLRVAATATEPQQARAA